MFIFHFVLGFVGRIYQEVTVSYCLGADVHYTTCQIIFLSIIYIFILYMNV